MFLQGVLGEAWWLDVVFWWCNCGGMRGERGVFAVVFSGLNNTPRFWDLFCWLLVLGVFRLGVGHLKLSLGRTTLGRATAKDRFSRRLVIR